MAVRHAVTVTIFMAKKEIREPQPNDSSLTALPTRSFQENSKIRLTGDASRGNMLSGDVLVPVVSSGFENEMDAINPELLRGSLELMVLSTLSSGKKYGYLIQSTLWESSQKAIEMKAGTLYPILHKLEKEGWVKCQWENETGRRRKWYELTALGRKQLRVRVDEWSRYVECLRGILGPLGELSPQLG